jgi:hypothetical protein
MTFFREWSTFSHLGKYVPGVSVTHYVENLHTTFGFAQVVLFVVGVIYIVRAKKSADFGILFCILAINIIVNTLAGAEVFHWTGSIGELRYIAVVGPFVGIVSVYALSEVLDRVKPSWTQLALSVLVFSGLVFNCTLTTHPRRWANYDRIVINMTKALRSEYPDLTLLSNNCIVAYVLDVAPSGGPHFAKLNTDMLAKYPECLILWDPFSSNPRFDQAALTKEKVLQDSTMVLLERYTYWDAEYLLLYRNVQEMKVHKRTVASGYHVVAP